VAVLLLAVIGVVIAGFATSWTFRADGSPPEKLIAVVAPEGGTSPTAGPERAAQVQQLLRALDSKATVRSASVEDLAAVAKQNGHVPYSYMIMPNLPTEKSGTLAGLPFVKREGPPDQLLIIPKNPLVYWQEEGAKQLGATPGFVTVPLSVRGLRYPVMVSTTRDITEVQALLVEKGWEAVV